MKNLLMVVIVLFGFGCNSSTLLKITAADGLCAPAEISSGVRMVVVSEDYIDQISIRIMNERQELLQGVLMIKNRKETIIKKIRIDSGEVKEITVVVLPVVKINGSAALALFGSNSEPITKVATW